MPKAGANLCFGGPDFRTFDTTPFWYGDGLLEIPVTWGYTGRLARRGRVLGDPALHYEALHAEDQARQALGEDPHGVATWTWTPGRSKSRPPAKPMMAWVRAVATVTTRLP